MPDPSTASADPPPDQLKDDGHDFDGIQEYDNNLPRWWLGLFVATVVWAVCYIPFYHAGPGKLGATQLKDEMAALDAERSKLAGPVLDEAGLRKIANDPARRASGKELWVKTGCVTCHGPDGYGQVGPNLRDDHWICEPTMTGITGVLKNGGRAGKGMNPFPQLGEDGMQDLAAYIVSLNRAGRKDNPAKPAAPDEKDAALDW